jgi:hypothetical protein
MSYIGSTPTTQSFISGTDYFNGTGAQTAFTLTRTVASVNDIEAVVNNVVQQPNDAYNISGTTITFTSAPSAGTSNVYVRYLSTTTQAISPSQGTVGWAQLNSDTQQDLGISFKNRIINGAMVIYQRGTSATLSGSATFVADRWVAYSSTGTATASQSSDAPAGFTNSYLYTQSSAGTRNAGDYYEIYQFIEGYNVADLNLGTANAKTFTLSFWVKSSVIGTYSVAFTNADATYQNYVSTYTVNVANTWEQKSITVPGTTAGTWNITNGAGLQIWFDLGSGATYQTATVNSWITGGRNSLASSSQVGFAQTTGATFRFTGVQLEVGTQATTFDNRDYGRELILCQRYYEVGGVDFSTLFSGNTTSGSTYYCSAVFKVTKRAAATGTTTTLANLGFPSTAASVSGVSPTTAFQLNKVANGTQAGGYFVDSWAASAEL